MINKSLDTYLNLCTQVYDLSKPEPLQNAYDFYVSYAKETKGHILEPMCGTGRYLLPMQRDGFTIEGFDASQSMLDALFAKAKSQKISPTVWHGYIECLQVSKQYGLIFIPSGSFGLITDLELIKKALKTIYDHLTKDGIFVFETETPHALPELGVWRGSTWRRPDNKLILLSQLARLDESLCYSIGKYELVDANQVVQTEIEEYKIRIYNEPSFLTTLLSEVGFKEIRLIKAFDRSSSPGKNDETVIYECKK